MKTKRTLNLEEACGILEAIHCSDDAIDGNDGDKTVMWLINSIYYGRFSPTIPAINITTHFSVGNGLWENSNLEQMVKSRLKDYNLQL